MLIIVLLVVCVGPLVWFLKWNASVDAKRRARGVSDGIRDAKKKGW